jgi:hypothetical protein
MPDAGDETFVATIIAAAEQDPTVARVLREICGLDGAVRTGALGLVAAHLSTRGVARDVFDCLDALKRDDVARKIAERLGPPA